MEINGKRIEELGFEASKMGFFQEWRSLTNLLINENRISLNEASEQAFKKLLSKLDKSFHNAIL
ncbi:Fe(2+)-trafficking protein [Flavobacterium algicola]|uniref:Fe(2+)-trafficking protein n=1 Tax=Flavobacterium algicola TaxID=556529 RepID=UPI001EFE9DC5|nr:Fe(2+)-trafficking protein [Flavobacterium algicola]MCG9792313.1 Fe(2+)-trafficking protein [Flavobacterium algicola]